MLLAGPIAALTSTPRSSWVLHGGAERPAGPDACVPPGGRGPRLRHAFLPNAVMSCCAVLSHRDCVLVTYKLCWHPQVLLARGFEFCDEREPEAPVFPLPPLQARAGCWAGLVWACGVLQAHVLASGHGCWGWLGQPHSCCGSQSRVLASWQQGVWLGRACHQVPLHDGHVQLPCKLCRWVRFFGNHCTSFSVLSIAGAARDGAADSGGCGGVQHRCAAASCW